FVEDEMVRVRRGLHPHVLDSQALQVHHTQQAGLKILPDGDQHDIVVFQAQLFDGGAVGDVSNDGARESVGVFFDEFGFAIHAEYRVTHSHQLERGRSAKTTQTNDGKLCHFVSVSLFFLESSLASQDAPWFKFW